MKPGIKKFRRILSDKEIEVLLRASTEIYKPVWYTFLTTGLRKSELVNLTWNDIDWEYRELLIQSKEGFSTKNEETRKIFIVDGLYEILKELKKKSKSKYVFVNFNGNPLKSHLLTRFKTTLKKAGLNEDGLDIHSLRYTFISSLLRGGANPKVVQRLVGHKNIKITMEIYARVLPNEERHAIKKLSYAQFSGDEKVLQLENYGHNLVTI